MSGSSFAQRVGLRAHYTRSVGSVWAAPQLFSGRFAPCPGFSRALRPLAPDSALRLLFPPGRFAPDPDSFFGALRPRSPA